MSRDADAGDWFVALGYALVGEQLPRPEIGGSDAGGVSASEVASWLRGQGWTPERVQQHRRVVRRAGEPWPHPLPPGTLGPGTAAQRHALLGELRTLLGVTGQVVAQRPAHPEIGPAERRLLADVPPHHGSV